MSNSWRLWGTHITANQSIRGWDTLIFSPYYGPSSENTGSCISHNTTQYLPELLPPCLVHIHIFQSPCHLFIKDFSVKSSSLDQGYYLRCKTGARPLNVHPAQHQFTTTPPLSDIHRNFCKKGSAIRELHTPLHQGLWDYEPPSSFAFFICTFWLHFTLLFVLNIKDNSPATNPIMIAKNCFQYNAVSRPNGL